MLWKKLLGSILVRVWIAAVSFILLLLTARFLGAEGRGEITLLIANIALIQLVIDIANGPAMIYLVPKIPIKTLVLSGLAWLFVISSLAFGVLMFYSSSIENFQHLIILSFLYANTSFILLIFQGLNKIISYSIFLILQHTVLFVGVLLQFFVFKNQSTQAFIQCLYFAYFICITGIIFLIPDMMKDSEAVNIKKGLTRMLTDGWKAQFSNVINFLNSRLSYYLIVGFFFDEKSLGKYATAVALSESVWVISYSLGAVQYPLLTRSTKEASALLTCGLGKISFYLSALAVLFLVVLPDSVYFMVLGKDFSGTGKLLLLLVPGVVALAVHKILWNYFSAAGEFHTNNVSNLVSLVFQIPFLVFLLFLIDLPGAAISASISSISGAVCLLIYFRKKSGISWKEILPGAHDVKQIRYVWRYRNH